MYGISSDSSNGSSISIGNRDAQDRHLNLTKLETTGALHSVFINKFELHLDISRCAMLIDAQLSRIVFYFELKDMIV